MLPRLLRWLRLAPGTPEAGEAADLWTEAQMLAQPATWRTAMGFEDFLLHFHPYARASTHLMRVLEGCPRVWLLIATLGPALEARSAGCFASGQPFAGYVLDRMGTFLVEQAMRDQVRKLSHDLSHISAHNCVLTRRYSPGYKDFSLEAQAAFFKLVQDALSRQSPEPGTTHHCLASPGFSVRLTGGYMLDPSKSITAVAGERDAQNQATESTRRR